MAPSRLVLTVSAAALFVLVGCTSNKPDPSGGAGSRSSSPPITSASPTTSHPSPTMQRTIDGDCSVVLPVSAVNEAVGLPVIGKTSFIIDIPDKSIGRLARIDCQYGIGPQVKGKPAPKPKVEVAVNLYNTAARAKQRISDSAEFYLENGAQQHTQLVGPLQGTLLTGYGMPTLLVAYGQRTIAVSADPHMAGDGTLNDIMSRIAQRAITGSNP